MIDLTFKTTVIMIAVVFTAIFGWVVIPPLLIDPDVLGAFTAGFVNPYSSGYSADVIACWAILASWIFYERKTLGVRYGWTCIALGLVPGVAVGFAVYLMMRLHQLGPNRA